MAVTIPPEYLGFDYGFSGVDSPPTANTAPPAPVIDSNELDQIHEKMDNILSEIARLNAAKNLTPNKASEDDLRTLESIIVPLLNNLLKTADKPYVYWPDRAPTIEAQLAKVLSITRP